ncbi:MAG: hypothetical protein WBP12_00550 [Candidatus Saccharimonas sp.]
MIILLTGDNTYQAAKEIWRLEREVEVLAERVSGDELDQARLADIMKGVSLFATTRLVVVDNLSARSDLWAQAAEWVGLVGDETTLVLRDEKPDKRTRAYKDIAKHATVVDAVSWTEKQRGLAERWLSGVAKESGIEVSGVQVRDMVSRALIPGQKSGQRVVDQQMLIHAVGSLKGVAEVNDDMITTVLPTATSDAVFDLLDIAVHGDANLLRQRLDDVRATQEGYQLLALILSQWSQLTMLALTKGEYAGEIHPFVKQKLQPLASKFTRAQLRDLTSLAAELDIASKSTGLSAWDAIERLLFGIVHRTYTKIT